MSVHQPHSDTGRPGAAGQVSRRSVLRVGAAAGVAALATRTGARRVAAGQGATSAASPAASECFLPSPMPGVPDAWVCPPPEELFQAIPTPPGNGETIRTLQIAYNPPVLPRDENPYWQELERRLNVRYEATWAPAANYGERFQTTIAGGDPPDLMFVDFSITPALGQLIEQGAFTDLTDYLSGDALQEFPNLAAFDPRIWRNASVNGRVYGVPRPRFLTSSLLVMRQDWVDRLGLPLPEDAERFAALVEAFTRNDPDGNGRPDTWGLATNAPRPDFNVLYFAQLFRAPNGWRRNEDGGLTHQLETDEYRQALDFARRLFAAGTFHPDAATFSVQQAKDGLVAGQVGAYLDAPTGLPMPNGLRARAQQVNPEANVIGLVPFGHDGGPGGSFNGTGFFGMAAIPAAAGQDEARLRVALGILNYFAAPGGSEEARFLGLGIEGVHHTVGPDGSRVRTEAGTQQIGGDFTNLTNGPTTSLWYPERPDDGRYMQTLLRDLLAIGIDDPTWGLYSATGADEGGTLGQLIADRRLAIVTGREPLSALDTLIEEWRTRGGDRIRQEYEDALQQAGA